MNTPLFDTELIILFLDRHVFVCSGCYSGLISEISNSGISGFEVSNPCCFRQAPEIGKCVFGLFEKRPCLDDP